MFEKKDLPSFFTIGLADHKPTLQLNIHRWFSQASPDLQFSLAMSAQGGSHGSSISPMASSGTDSATTQLPSASLDPSLSDLQPVQSVLQLLPLYVKVAIERELGLAGNSLHVRRVTKCVSVQQQNGCQWLSTPYQRIEGQTRGCVWADLSHRKTHSRTSRPSLTL